MFITVNVCSHIINRMNNKKRDGGKGWRSSSAHIFSKFNNKTNANDFLFLIKNYYTNIMHTRALARMFYFPFIYISRRIFMTWTNSWDFHFYECAYMKRDTVKLYIVRGMCCNLKVNLVLSLTFVVCKDSENLLVWWKLGWFSAITLLCE